MVNSKQRSLNNNFVLTECKGCTGEYWPEFVAVGAKHSEACPKIVKDQYCAVWLELARLESSLLYSTWAQNNMAYDCFH